MKEEKVIDNSIHAENSVVIGDGNTLRNSKIATKEPTSKHWLIEHFWVPLIVAIIAGMVVILFTKWA